MSVKEFISIHVTFSVMHSWMTYFVIYTFFRAVIQNNNDPDSWFHRFMHEFGNSKELLSVDIELWGVIVMVIMLVEMSIYLAYYKDIIFSIITLTNYVGMYLHYLKTNNYFSDYVG